MMESSKCADRCLSFDQRGVSNSVTVECELGDVVQRESRCRPRNDLGKRWVDIKRAHLSQYLATSRSGLQNLHVEENLRQEFKVYGESMCGQVDSNEVSW